MGEVNVTKMVITITNIIILLGLPFMTVWHVKQARKKQHLSDKWMIQILIIFAYLVAIGAEIPALWSRYKAYYTMHLNIPDGLYELTMWDRYNHLFFYGILFCLTYTFTREKVPNIIRNTLS